MLNGKSYLYLKAFFIIFQSFEFDGSVEDVEVCEINLTTLNELCDKTKILTDTDRETFSEAKFTDTY